MSDLSRLLDDVYGTATVTSLTSTAARAAVATAPAPPAALPDPAPLPPVAPDPAALLEGFFDLDPDEHDDVVEPVAEEPVPAMSWDPSVDDILPPRRARGFSLRRR